MVASPSSSVLSNSSSSSLTPTSSTPSTCTITPATYAAATVSTTTTTPVPSHRPYPLSASAVHAASAARTTSLAGDPDPGALSPRNTSRIPVTPAVLRSIFASSRSPGEERSLSRIAFFRFSGFIISCLAISLAANQGRGIRTGAALLGVGV